MPNQDQNSNDSGAGKKAGGVAAVILAAGESRRSGDANKLLFEAGGAPLMAEAVAQHHQVEVRVGHVPPIAVVACRSNA